MHHTVVISDVHLCEVEPGEGLWMRYRQRPFSPAGEIAKMIEDLRARVAGDRLTFVLNGDVFDFDAPRVIDSESVFHNLPRTAENAVPAIKSMLDDHPAFVAAVARLLLDGHRVVFITGNHDVQLTLPEVRDALRERLCESAAEQLEDRGEDSGVVESLRSQIIFRAWFYKTPDGIVIEHGNQYDPYCCYRYPMAPFGADPREIHPTMGSLATRLLVSRMGYFNPHVDDSYMLSGFGYLKHWARYYLFSRRSLALAWAVGALRMVFLLIRRRRPAQRALRRENIRACARETGESMKVIARHSKLFARPSEDRLSLVIRELWLDRVGLLFISVLFGLVYLLVPETYVAVGALMGPLAVVVYELAIPKNPIESIWRRINRMARHIGKLHKARAVILGHTHHAEAAWENGVFYGNSGSWSAAYRDLECTQPMYDERPVLWLTSDDRGELSGGLWAWKDGKLNGLREGKRADEIKPAALASVPPRAVDDAA